MNKLNAAIISHTPIADGFLKVDRYEFEVDKHEGGRERLVREVMHRGHAVGVLGFDPVRDEIVLVSEFRPGCLLGGDDPFTANIVAGGVGDGEDPVQAAVREMKEETGLELRDPVLAHPGAYVSSGGSSEKIAIVVGVVDANEAGGVHGNAEESEDLLTVVVPRDEFIRRVRNGEISDLKTLVAGYWLADNADRFRA